MIVHIMHMILFIDWKVLLILTTCIITGAYSDTQQGMIIIIYEGSGKLIHTIHEY